MRRAFLIAIGAICALGFVGGAVAEETAAPAKKIELKSCDLPGAPPEARCGTYEVWENRSAKAGRRIPLRVMVIPALGQEKLPDPFVFFTGGPGDSSVDAGVWISQEFKDLRQRRDILLVDYRGTGGSNPLNCPDLQGTQGIQGFLDDFLPADKIKRCAEELGKKFDLTQYTSDAAIDDIDEVRAALGYDEINLLGGSYGSRAALVYLRRHPQRVRTAILSGAVPTDELGPFSMARSAQDALDGLIAECEADAACKGAFPKLREEVAAVLQRAEREPVTVRLVDTETGGPVEVRLSKTGVAQTLRYMLYGTASAMLLPLNVHLAAQGDWKLMAETARFFASAMGSTSDGYYLAITCSEDLPFIRESEVPAAVAGTFLGDFRIRKQQAACAAWPAAKLGREFLAPVASDVPVLLISGERDPVTPPSNADHVARTLKNSRHIVVPDGGHSFSGIQGVECVTSLMVSFVESGRLEGLDASCVARMKRPEFVLKVDPEVKLTADQLALFQGSYKDAESGIALQVDRIGGYLRGKLGPQPAEVLIPTGSARFRIQGMPPDFTVTFQVSDGRVTGVVLQNPGQPALTLRRES